MDTKWKNKTLPYAGMLSGIYFLTLGLFCVIDLWGHQSLWIGPYLPVSSGHPDYTYYVSIRNRLIKEGALGVLSLGGGGYLLWRLRALLPSRTLGIVRRLPLDIRIGAVLPVLWLLLTAETDFFHLPVYPTHFLQLTFGAVMTVWLCLIARDLYLLVKQPQELRSQWKQSLTMENIRGIRDAFADAGALFRLLLFGGLTVLWGLVAGAAMGSSDTDLHFIALFYTLIYIVILAPNLLRKLGRLNRLRMGVKDLSEGNLDMVLEERGKGPLAELAVHINNMKQGYRKALEERLRSERLKTELITNVSHDLKTPLTSIVNYVDLLKQEDLPPDTHKHYIEVLTRKTERLKALIDDLFEASKMTSGSVKLELEQVDVNALQEQAMAEFSDRIAASSLTFRVKTAHSGICATLDGRKIWRVFENLIGNALKYSQPNTRVYIALEEADRHVEWSIRNISAYEIEFAAEELLERFKRADPSRTTEGSGLGLAIAKSIVELHGGTLEIVIDGDLFKVTVRLPK